jgi:glycosyltransferase involved in cell wall biosynthesis
MPTVVLEAAAAMRAAVAFEATGTVDAIVDNETGLLVPAGDDEAFARAAARLLSDSELSARLGAQAADRVGQLFDNRAVWNSWGRFFEQIS